MTETPRPADSSEPDSAAAHTPQGATPAEHDTPAATPAAPAAVTASTTPLPDAAPATPTAGDHAATTPGATAPTVPLAPPSGTPLDGAPPADVPPTFIGTAAAERKSRRVAPVVAALIVGALLGGAAGGGIAAAVSSTSHGNTSLSQAAPQTVTVNNPDSISTATAVAAKAGASVVTISATASSASGTGSGVVLSADGYILTNTHVVTLDGAAANATLEVTTADGHLYAATLVGTDPTMDLAVIKLTNASGLTPITFGDSTKLNVGDATIAIGAPLGLSNSVTEGIVSALNRSIQIASSAAPSGDSATPAPNSGGQAPFQFNFGQGQTQASTNNTISLPVIQTDASINPGNSGGALLNAQGQLIGINVAIASTGSTSTTSQSGSIGVGFAIPSDVAKRVSDAIIATGSATHGLLGASVSDAKAATSSTVGAALQNLTAGGAAATAGLKPGDVVTQFNGLPITSASDLTAQVRALAAGTTTSLTYVRNGQATKVNVTLGKL